ncbi:rcd1/Caf40 [Artemisia annua]|uniref:Rcd1/Caf40 n=1 Tax=Artemisia annua TaxID=35608 RepID=A0A2U1NR68_ARTAN|nr:rcd1/Caf40 [Artemisia annua]
MDSLPDSLYMDYAARSSSSTNAPPPNNAGATSALSASELSKIRRLIPLVNLPRTRSEAITQLTNIFKANKAGGPELGLLLWESQGIMFSLLEVCSCPYIQGAQIPTYFYSYMNTESPASQYDYLRLSGLGVIGALVKETGPDTPNIVRYLLQAETVPVCLRCMEMGSDLTKSVATLILGRIFSQEEGKAYIGSFVDRFYVLTKALQKVVDEFNGIPPPALLRNIMICYLRLSELSRLCRCSDALKRCYPMQLRHPAYLNYICAGGPELGLLLWESRGTMFSLLEVCSCPYIPCAQIPTSFYSYMTTGSPALQYDYLRLYGLGVIGALVKETGPNTLNVVRYLLQVETVPMCLRCLEMDGDLTKSIRTPNFPTHELGVLYDYSETLFTIKIHHAGYFTIPPNRRYRFGDIDYVDLIDCHLFSIQQFVSMLDELGLGVDTKLYTHFRILGESLDDGLVPLMSEEDMVTLLKYVPRFKETESLKSVVIEEIEDEDKDDVFNEAEKDGKDVVMEDVKHGDMFLSEWHGATEMGKVDKEGKQVEHSTNHASSSKVDCCNEENEFFPDFDDEIVIPTLWSAEVCYMGPNV